MPASRFDIAACELALGSDAHAFQLNALAQCDSTNTQLMQLAESGAVSGTVLVADEQTAGRGRRQRSWVSSPQDSLTFSLLWRFPPDSQAPEALSLVVGLGVQRALHALGITVALKWPNDILCGGNKLVGILIETQPGDIKSVIIGIGVNLSLPSALPEEVARNATALDRIASTPPTRENLLAMILKHLAAIIATYSSVGFAALSAEWQARNAYQGADVIVSGGSEDIRGRCVGIGERGELLVDTDAGRRRVISGDVSLRPAQ